MVLRARIDMASPNINLRDPAIYRIRHATHHRTGDRWCIYPMYTFAHPIEDALEQITHSICTLEFEDQRPFYDWLLERLCEAGLLTAPPPRQYEFTRLNVGHVITSKRKLRQLVEERHVSGWDDPRMPTLAGLRRRGYTPESRACLPSARASPRPATPGPTTPPWTPPCAKRWTRTPRAPWPCWSRSSWSSRTGPRCSAATRTWSPATPPCTRTSPSWASAPSCSARRCGSSAPTTKRRRPKASSGCSPATRCG